MMHIQLAKFPVRLPNLDTFVALLVKFDLDIICTKIDRKKCVSLATSGNSVQANLSEINI